MLASTLIGLLALFPTNPAILTVPIAHAAQITPQQQWLHSLEKCESHGNPNAAIVDSNGYWSRGILQFQLSTWLAAGNRYGIATTRDNVFDPALQEQIATLMLDDGGEGNWYTCSRQAVHKLGPWPTGDNQTPPG